MSVGSFSDATPDYSPSVPGRNVIVQATQASESRDRTGPPMSTCFTVNITQFDQLQLIRSMLPAPHEFPTHVSIPQYFYKDMAEAINAIPCSSEKPVFTGEGRRTVLCIIMAPFIENQAIERMTMIYKDKDDGVYAVNLCHIMYGLGFVLRSHKIERNDQYTFMDIFLGAHDDEEDVIGYSWLYPFSAVCPVDRKTLKSKIRLFFNF